MITLFPFEALLQHIIHFSVGKRAVFEAKRRRPSETECAIPPFLYRGWLCTAVILPF